MNAFALTGFAELERFLDELPEKLQAKVARVAMAAGARVIRDEARLVVPKKSGALKRSIRSSSGRARDGQITATIKAGNKDAFYAHMVEFGTQPHDIRPKKAKALKIGGGYALLMHHPGARPKPFMRPAYWAHIQ